MFPWVILYGFTALLFNHPTWFADRNTTIQHFELSSEQKAILPTAEHQSQAVFQALSDRLGETTSLELEVDFDSSVAPTLKGMFVALADQPTEFVAVVMDPKTGKGFVRRINRPKKDRKLDLGVNRAELEKILTEPIKIDVTGPALDWSGAARQLLPTLGVDAIDAQLQQLPRLEFSIRVGEKSVPMRFAPSLAAPTTTISANPSEPEVTKEVAPIPRSFSGDLIAIEVNQRDLSWRSYLLSLHLAHGYPFEITVRWFWAIAVDLMFASMIFWGISGLIMWWQIKRTRRIGWLLLFISAVFAFGLAYGMHLDFANGTPL
jgi:hypothetical protein